MTGGKMASAGTSRTCFQRCLVPLIVAVLGLQLVFVWLLVWHHELFQIAINDITHLTSTTTVSIPLEDDVLSKENVNESETANEGARGDEMRRGFRAVKKHSVVAPSESNLNEAYRTFPVKIVSPHSTTHVPEASRLVVEALMGGKVVETDFPDLAFRSSASVRSQYPRIFSELPSYGFNSSRRNPCWRREGDKSMLAGGALACLPYAYILGQPKCGTSDLFERLKAHGGIIMPRRKEVRWFTRGEFMTTAMPHEGEETRLPGDGRKEILIGKDTSIYSFTNYFSALARSLERPGEDSVTIDGGPHTLWWPTQSPDGSFLPNDIPPAQLLREIQPKTKFMVTLSDPVKRMYSDYYFLDDDLKPVHPGSEQSKSSKQFHDRVVQQVNGFQRCVDAYLEVLQPQFGQEHLFAPKFELDLTEKYKQQLPLWFRASQMCAHDRHRFAVGGWGRIAIGLYVLFLEKWFEHFTPDQFLILRLEDYEENPQGYLMNIFRFLQIDQPDNWSKIMTTKHFNEHRIQREPILEETEKVLRAFYKPYNQLLVHLTTNPDFEWEYYVLHGNEVSSLRAVQLVEQRAQDVSMEDVEDVEGNMVQHHTEHDRHRLSRMNHEHPAAGDEVFDEEAQLWKDAPMAKPVPVGGLRGAQRLEDQVRLSPASFDTFDLPAPGTDEDVDLVDFKALDFTNADVAGKALCEAAFTMHIAKLKFLLHDVGVPANLVNPRDANRNAFHCLASTYTLADAHSKSHVFAELKGKTTWVTKKLNPPLETKVQSVLARDVVEHLADATQAAAKWLIKAAVPIDAKDSAGHTPLHHAVIGGNQALVELLLANGAEVNVPNRDRRTPLHFAAAYGRAEIAALLIKAGADLKLEDTNHVTPFDMVSNPGAIHPDDALKLLGMVQRPVKTIRRILHPELHNTSNIEDPSLFSADGQQFLGWVGGTGGWRADRLEGFEQDMSCDCVDQYYAHEISGSDIFNKYLARNAPVLIRGLLSDWEAVRHFASSALETEHGDLGVQVSDIPYATKFGGAQTVDMTLADYIEEVRAHKMLGGKHPWYVFKGHPIPHGSEGKDSLVKYDTCPTPASIQEAFLHASPNAPNMEAYRNGGVKSREIFINAQWALGGEGTGAPIHFHNTAWSALLYGAKKWLIYPPHNMIMSNKQILDFFESDMEDFSRRGVRPVTCVQTAGDVMIIPESWGHGVLNIQESVALATEFKYSGWRIKPSIATINQVPAFENRADRRVKSGKRRTSLK